MNRLALTAFSVSLLVLAASSQVSYGFDFGGHHSIVNSIEGTVAHDGGKIGTALGNTAEGDVNSTTSGIVGEIDGHHSGDDNDEDPFDDEMDPKTVKTYKSEGKLAVFTQGKNLRIVSHD